MWLVTGNFVTQECTDLLERWPLHGLGPPARGHQVVGFGGTFEGLQGVGCPGPCSPPLHETILYDLRVREIRIGSLPREGHDLPQENPKRPDFALDGHLILEYRRRISVCYKA